MTNLRITLIHTFGLRLVLTGLDTIPRRYLFIGPVVISWWVGPGGRRA